MNVKEDTGIEVAHSGHSSGSGYVKNEEIAYMDASKNAEEPIQKIAQKAMRRKIANLPSIPMLLLNERERAAQPAAAMHPQHLNRERK